MTVLWQWLPMKPATKKHPRSRDGRCLDGLIGFHQQKHPGILRVSTSAGDQPGSGDLSMSKAKQVAQSNSPTWMLQQKTMTS